MSEATPTKKRTPPAKLPANKQYDLFTTFFGDAADLSNTIELWDAIPKYCVSARQQGQMRDERGRLPVHAQEFEYRPPGGQGRGAAARCKVKIQPAAIEVEDGVYRDFYPSVDEELVEEVLRKIFSDQQYGMHSPSRNESWVQFTLYLVQKELKARGRTRSLDEIKQSLEILSRAVYEVELSNSERRKLVYTNPILGDLTRTTRADYVDDPRSRWCARLPALLSKSINELSYRQFNYAVLMSLDSQLARWLHKRLSHHYTNAGIMYPYGLLYSTIERDSGLLQHSRSSVNRKTVDQALEELRQRSVLLGTSSEVRRRGRKVEDVFYKLTPAPEFVSEVKAANARQRDHKELTFRNM